GSKERQRVIRYTAGGRVGRLERGTTPSILFRSLRLDGDDPRSQRIGRRLVLGGDMERDSARQLRRAVCGLQCRIWSLLCALPRIGGIASDVFDTEQYERDAGTAADVPR